MDWNNHFNLEGKHAYLSPSGYSWLNYDREKMANNWNNNKAKEDGTRMHALASEMIKYRIIPADHKKALNQFVKDCIAGNLSSEVLLFYSYNCFGTADGISFDEANKVLRVYDLKTGVSRPSFKQLYIYCALFCLEYLREFRTGDLPVKLEKITFVCRLYQGRGFTESVIEAGDVDVDTGNNPIRDIVNQIIEMDEVISEQAAERRKLGL